MAKTIGIDFGTTNSLITVILSDKARYFLDGSTFPYPSLVTYDSGIPVVGREAKARLENACSGNLGDIIRAPKRLLGKGSKYIEGREYQPSEVVRDVMLFLKQSALNSSDSDVVEHCDFTKAVVSIPVAMDGRARSELRDALLQAGINIVQFVHEPLAALYAHFRAEGSMQQALERYHDKLVLVYDWGGGTLDLTLCHILDQRITQIANEGDNEVGGDYIDEAIVDFVLNNELKSRNLTETPPIQIGARARLLEACERAKIRLSDRNIEHIYVEDFFAFDDDSDPDVEMELSREALDQLSSGIINRGLSKIDSLLKKLDIDQRRISLCLATGGMINMPRIKERLLEKFSIDRLCCSDRGDRIISEGCAWIANDNARLTLAKPVEVREARNSYLKVFREGSLLPSMGEAISESLMLYCVDPRDGKAKIQLCRPEKADRMAALDERASYENLVVPVDANLKPFDERISIDLRIDHNLILSATAASGITHKTANCEIYDLEFGLSLPGKPKRREDGAGSSNQSPLPRDVSVQSVVGLSNVCAKQISAKIPGEYLRSYDVRAFDPEFGRATKEQHDESFRYIPCSGCGRYWNHPDCRCAS